ncbi:hypothetical protein KBB68_02565, partial [Candidatus Babeliales bacterium]|nr:hypothetical protein [Candidatus Babeliales bacterium]
MKFKTIVIFVSFVLLSNFILSSDLREGMTAPLPPKFEPIPFDVDFARNFLQKMIMVKFVLGEDSEIKIEQDWEMIILNEKRKDQKENNTINNKNNAKIWIQEAYGKMIKFLTVNRKAQKKFEILCYPYIKKYPELETSASLKVLFFKKQYTNFLQSDELKNVMFDFGMNVLGYTNTMISGDEHPVGGHNEKKSTV